MAAEPATSDLHNDVETNAVDPKETPENYAALPKHDRPSLYTILTCSLTQVLSMLFVKLLMHPCIYIAWKAIGVIFCEWPLNFLVFNNGIFVLFFRLVTFSWSRIVFPLPDDDKYASCIGHMDPRTKLFLDTSSEGKNKSKQANPVVFPDEDVGSRSTADVCVMAAKLAYESPAFVQRVVTKEWKMHFVKFFNCWNEYQKMHNTQAFLFTDKKENANAIVVAFRGTEGFNTYDWSTDFDFTWAHLEGVGNVHLGFLEALGLASRDKPGSLKKMRDNMRDKNSDPATAPMSGLADYLIRNDETSLAFDDINKEVANLMDNNPEAKLFITGHSLGGALATLYPVMLDYFSEDDAKIDLDKKIGAVYTFGQPRVGDDQFSKYASKVMKEKYIRVVYCNDVVPRIPFDGHFMKFKHFGDCVYFNSVYDGVILTNEPSPNYIGVGRFLPTHLNAIWEMFQAMILITVQHGKEYSESWYSLMSRMMGFGLPGFSAHSPTNYVNAVRLGTFPQEQIMVSKRFAELRVMADNVMGIVAAVCIVVMRALGFPDPEQAVKLALFGE